MPLAHPTARTILLATALMDADCSALLAIEPGCAAWVSSPVSLLALPPSCVATPLARSLVPSARTACRTSAINVGVGLFFLRSAHRPSLRCTPHARQRGRTCSAFELGFCVSTATAASNRRSSGELDSSTCAFSHAVSALMEVTGSAGCSNDSFADVGANHATRDDDAAAEPGCAALA